MGSPVKVLERYLLGLSSEQRDAKRLRVFDFDDTLVRTDATVHVQPSDGEAFDLAPGEFAAYEPRPGDAFNYDDFETLINPRAIKWMLRILRYVHDHHGPNGVAVLSARGNRAPIEQFLRDEGMHGIEVAALGDASPRAKASWVDGCIRQRQLEHVEYFDDAHKNVMAVRELQERHPNVTIVAHHVVGSRIASLLR